MREEGTLNGGMCYHSLAEHLSPASRQPGCPVYFPLTQPMSPARRLYHLRFLPCLLWDVSPCSLKALLAVDCYLVASQWAWSHQVPCEDHREMEEGFTFAKTLQSCMETKSHNHKMSVGCVAVVVHTCATWAFWLTGFSMSCWDGLQRVKYGLSIRATELGGTGFPCSQGIPVPTLHNPLLKHFEIELIILSDLESDIVI